MQGFTPRVMDKDGNDMEYPIMASDPSSALVHRSYHHIPDPSQSQGFSFLSRAGHFRAGPRYRNERQSVPGHEIFYCLKGRGYVRQDGHSDTVAAGQIVWIDVNHPHVHWADPDEPWEVYWLRAEGAQLNATHALLRARSQLCMPAMEPEETIRTFENLFTLCEKRRQPFDALANAEVARLLALCAESTRPAPDGGDGVSPELADILEEMRIYYQRPWRINDIARRCGKSPAQTHRLFHKAIGTSPVAWLRRIRIEQAMQKLAGTTDTVAEIAYQVGYNDPLFFSRDFKRATGLPPTGYRQRERS